MTDQRQTKAYRVFLSFLLVSDRLQIHPSELTRKAWRKHKPPTISGQSTISLGGWGPLKGFLVGFLEDQGVHPSSPLGEQVDLDRVAVEAAEKFQPPEQPLPGQPSKEAVQEYRQRRAEQEASRERMDLIRQLAEAQDRLRAFEAFASIPESPPIEHSTDWGTRRGTAVLLLSDWHPGDVVAPETVNHLNAYNQEIAAERVKSLVDGFHWTLNMWRNGYQIDDLVIALLGDMVTGWIHEEQLVSNSMTPPQEVVFGTNLAESALLGLDLDQFETVRVVCVTGNHGRTTKRIHHSNRAVTSYEWIMYHELARRFPNAAWHIPNSEFAYMDIAGLKTRFAHGDFFKYRKGIGGIAVPMHRAIKGLDQAIAADLTCIGHWHQYMGLPRLITNASIVGFSPFAQRFGFAPEPPSQTLALIDHKRKLVWPKRLWV